MPGHEGLSLNQIFGSQSNYGTFFNTASTTGGLGNLNLGGGGGGPGLSGLFAGAGALLAALGPIGIIGGVIMGIVAGLQTSSENKKRRERHFTRNKRINVEMLYSGAKLIFDQQDVGRVTTKQLGAAALVTQEGISHDEATASALNDSFVATANLQLDFDLRTIISNLEKQDSAMSARSSDVGLAIVGGVMSGFGLGAPISAAISHQEQIKLQGGQQTKLFAAQLTGLQQTGSLNKQLFDAQISGINRAGDLRKVYFDAVTARARIRVQTARNFSSGAGLRLNFARQYSPIGGPPINRDNIGVWTQMWQGIGGIGGGTSELGSPAVLPAWARSLRF